MSDSVSVTRKIRAAPDMSWSIVIVDAEPGRRTTNARESRSRRRGPGDVMKVELAKDAADFGIVITDSAASTENGVDAARQ